MKGREKEGRSRRKIGKRGVGGGKRTEKRGQGVKEGCEVRGGAACGGGMDTQRGPVHGREMRASVEACFALHRVPRLASRTVCCSPLLELDPLSTFFSIAARPLSVICRRCMFLCVRFDRRSAYLALVAGAQAPKSLFGPEAKDLVVETSARLGDDAASASIAPTSSLLHVAAKVRGLRAAVRHARPPSRGFRRLAVSDLVARPLQRRATLLLRPTQNAADGSYCISCFPPVSRCRWEASLPSRCCCSGAPQSIPVTRRVGLHSRSRSFGGAATS